MANTSWWHLHTFSEGAMLSAHTKLGSTSRKEKVNKSNSNNNTCHPSHELKPALQNSKQAYISSTAMCNQCHWVRDDVLSFTTTAATASAAELLCYRLPHCCGTAAAADYQATAMLISQSASWHTKACVSRLPKRSRSTRACLTISGRCFGGHYRTVQARRHLLFCLT